MGEKSEKYLRIEADVFPLQPLQFFFLHQSKPGVTLHLCKTQDAIISIWKPCNSHIYWVLSTQMDQNTKEFLVGMCILASFILSEIPW